MSRPSARRSPPRLSKSRYLSGCQCTLKLWYDCYDRNLAAPIDLATQAVFDTGHEVGALARDRYPGGALVAHDYRHPREALAETRTLVADPAVAAIYEGALEHRGVLVRADILERVDGGWRLVEVKSSTGVKAVHEPDVAIQAWVLRGAGLKLVDAGVLTLDRSYIYDGVSLDLDRLFAFTSVLEVCDTQADSIAANVTALAAMLAAPRAPDIAPGDQCFTPYECGYYAHCARGMTPTENPLGDLPRLSVKRREALEALGVDTIDGIPDDFPLTELQRIVRDAMVNGTDHVHGDLAGALAELEPPVRYLDFETFAPAIPRFADTRPYDAIPFQFSMHAEDGDRLDHHEYLHGDDRDPRRALAEALIDALGGTGSICVYTVFEATVIRGLARDLPDLAGRLEPLVPRLFDLHAVLRRNYYHPEFHGSFSIKRVLPVIAPDLDYTDLAISDGRLAAHAYEQARRADLVDRARILDDLRAYCERDTLAMVELKRWLITRADA